MVFILVEEIVVDDSWPLVKVAAIEKLTAAMFDGSHFLAIESPNVGERLLATAPGTFSAVSVAIFKRLLAGFSFQGALFENGFYTIAVAPLSVRQEVGGRHSRVLPIEEVPAMNLQPTILLAEHRVDAEVYHKAAEHVIVHRRLKGVCVSSECRGGGGSSIVDEFFGIASSNRGPCFSITDSDIRCPLGPQSAASRKCMEVIRESPLLAAHYVLPVRELENLVPLDVVEEFVQGPVQEAVSDLKRITNGVPAVREFCDLKDGVMGAQLFRLPEDSPERVFLESVFIAALKKENGCLRRADCFQERNGGNCDCVVVPKIGAVGDRFRVWLQTQSAHKALESFEASWKEAWINVGSAVLRWCCSPPRMRG